MEVLSQFGRGENPLQDLAPCAPCNQTTPDNLDSPGVSSSSPAPLSPLLSPVATLPHHPMSVVPLASDPHQDIHTRSFMYLMDCYARVAMEERNHPKVSNCMKVFPSCFNVYGCNGWQHMVVLLSTKGMLYNYIISYMFKCI
jgi:ubiquitin conjugation factor E4 B